MTDAVRRRIAVGLALALATALVILSLAQFQRAISTLGAIDPAVDPLVGTLTWIQIVLTIILAPIIGVLVGAARGHALAAAALAAGAVSAATVLTPVFERLMTPDARYVVTPLGGLGSGGGFTPFLVIVGIVVGGSIAALEAGLAASIARRVSEKR